MNVALKTENVCVIDHLLPQKDFLEVWDGLQSEQFSAPHMQGKWLKAWRLTGGSPLWGPPKHRRTGDYLDVVWDAFMKLRVEHPEFVTKPGMTLTPYIYPPGTKLAWHADHDYAGAFTYYCHPQWGATWGGELLIATTKSEKQHRSGLEHRWEDEYLLAEGHGLYIACKPNRIVLQKPGTWHAINRVDSDAGDHLRVSIVAFFE
ncbi:MAG: 2OG-Fe(II) oxygenase [Blastocatellia bacterium]|nr:2OG-Fe(II) oxygenase [Blastocatellia bacterium]